MINSKLKLQLLFEWLQWNLTWIKSDRSCQNKFSRSIFWYLCCVPANNLSGTHPSPRLSVGLNCSISHKTSCPSYSPYTLQHCVHCWKLIQSSILYFLVVHAFLLVRQHTVLQYNFLLRVSGSEFAQAFINSRQSKLFASLLYIQSWLFLTKIC